MSEFDKIIKLTKDEKVELGESFKELLHTHLQLGQSRWVCRYGTLSDGHEKITSAQKYYQAIKEMFVRSKDIQLQKVLAMRAQADLIDASERLEKSTKSSDRLRAEADILEAKNKLVYSLINIEDQLRQVDEFNKVRLELKNEVESKYPLGIEQAESDNWEAVYKYRIFKSQTPGLMKESTSNIPLPSEKKAQLGVECNRADSMAPLGITDPDKLFKMIQNNADSLKQIGTKHV